MVWLSKNHPLAQYNNISAEQAACFDIVAIKHLCDKDMLLSYHGLKATHNIKLTPNSDILLDLLINENCLCFDVFINGPPSAYPRFAKQTTLLYKPYLYASAEMTFTLFYREECEKFYPTIADFFSSI